MFVLKGGHVQQWTKGRDACAHGTKKTIMQDKALKRNHYEI
jgi:hypothetical protein